MKVYTISQGSHQYYQGVHNFSGHTRILSRCTQFLRAHASIIKVCTIPQGNNDTPVSKCTQFLRAHANITKVCIISQGNNDTLVSKCTHFLRETMTRQYQSVHSFSDIRQYYLGVHNFAGHQSIHNFPGPQRHANIIKINTIPQGMRQYYLEVNNFSRHTPILPRCTQFLRAHTKATTVYTTFQGHTPT